MDISGSVIGPAVDETLDLNERREKTYANVTDIDCIEEPVSYEYFFSKYLLPNRACILGDWATASWRSRNDWVKQDGSPDLDFFKTSFGKFSLEGVMSENK